MNFIQNGKIHPIINPIKFVTIEIIRIGIDFNNLNYYIFFQLTFMMRKDNKNLKRKGYYAEKIAASQTE